MKYLTWKTFSKAMGWSVLASVVVFVICFLTIWLLSSYALKVPDPDFAHAMFTMGCVFSVAVFPFAVGYNINEQILKVKRAILEKKIADDEAEAKEFWSKYTFYGKVVEDATGKVLEEWTKKGYNFYPPMEEK
jgi:Cu/Ag efflux pump CusA